MTKETWKERIKSKKHNKRSKNWDLLILFFISIIVVAFSINGFTKLYTKSWCMQDICLCFFFSSLYILTQLSYVVSLSRKNKNRIRIMANKRAEWPVFASLYISLLLTFILLPFFFSSFNPDVWMAHKIKIRRMYTQNIKLHIFTISFTRSISKWSKWKRNEFSIHNY